MEGGVDDATGASQAAGPPVPGHGPRLAVRLEGQTVRTVPVSGTLRIGRERDNDLVFEGSGVAEHHARIYPRDGDWYLCSEGAATTCVNGITLIGHRRLLDGDRIRVGDTQLLYHAPGGTSRHSRQEPAGDDATETDEHELLLALRGTPSAPGSSRPTSGRLPRLRLPWQATGRRAAQGRQQKPAVVLTPAGLLVLLALAAIAAYLIAPDTFERRRSDKRLTPVVVASAPGVVVPTRTQPAASVTPGSRSATPLASGTAAAVDDLTLLLSEAEALVLRSQCLAAAERYQSLLEQYPRDVRVQAAWARALLLDGEIEQSIVHAEEATKIDPDSAQAWTVLARGYAARGETSSALSAGRRAVALAGQDEAGRAHAALAEAYLAGGLLPQAVEQADLALAHPIPSADAFSIRGRLYLLADGDPQAAVDALRRAAEIEPELWVRHQELGLMLFDLGDYRAAIDALTQAMVLCHKPVTYTALGRAHYQLGEYDQGKSYLEQSLSLGNRDLGTYALLAAMNAEQGRCNDARAYYNHVFDQDPTHALALQAQQICEEGAVAAGTGTTATSTAAASGTRIVPTATPPGATPAPPLPGWIAFSTWNATEGDYDTYVARPDGSERRLVASQMHQPAFQPGGQWLALNGEQPLHMNMHVVRLDGGDAIEISEYLEDRMPSWSPDGKSLVYSSTRSPDRQARLYVVDYVPFDGRRADDRTLRAGIYDVLGDYPTWLPDGRIVYTGCDWSSGATRCGLLAVSSAPGAQTLEALTDYPGDTAATAGPDGQIAFMSDRDGNWDIYLLTRAGDMRRLTQHPANDGLPAWSPSGNYLAFVSDRGGVWAVWAIRPDGGGVRKLFDLEGGGLAVNWQHESISWGP